MLLLQFWFALNPFTRVFLKLFAGLCGSDWWVSTGDLEVAGWIPISSGNIFPWSLIMKYFLQSIYPFWWFKKGSCQFLVKECAQVPVNCLEPSPGNVWLGKLTALNMTLMGWLGLKTSTQSNSQVVSSLCDAECVQYHSKGMLCRQK